MRSEFPDLHVSRSAEVFGNMREYERWTTATMNAYTHLMFDRYIRASGVLALFSIGESHDRSGCAPAAPTA